MIGIGLRVYSNSNIFYTIIEETETEFNYISISNLKIPLALNEPERLNYVRNTLRDIISEYKIDTALIRVKESVSNVTGLSIQRFYVEGVILETLAAANISKYKLGKIATITSLLSIETSKFKEYADNEITFELLPSDLDWSKLTLEERESILSCHASLKIQ
jgi:Holliday junction resolvasome RuvABC endonuclease subunit